MNTLCKPFKKTARAENADGADGRTTGRVCMIDTDKLYPNPSQPRVIFEDEPLLRLADSIRKYGILQPLSVRRIEDPGNKPPAYQIIAGERRWRAARIVGMQFVPCLVLDIDGKKSAELALIENIQREDLNIFEQAAAIASLIDVYGLTQEQAARQLSTSQSFVANKLRILRFTPLERNEIIKNRLTERHARALLRISDHELRLRAISYITAKELNVSAAEKYIDRLLSPALQTGEECSRMKGILKDLRFFYNSVDRAVGILKDCGVDVVTEKKEDANGVSVTIRISC